MSKTKTIKCTHYGMFGICPVMYAEIESESPYVIERSFLYKPLLWISDVLFDMYFTVQSWVDPESQQPFKMRVDGEFKEPIYMEVDDIKE